MSRNALACGWVLGFKKPHAIALRLIDLGTIMTKDDPISRNPCIGTATRPAEKGIARVARMDRSLW
jgi:hypothetical protein